MYKVNGLLSFPARRKLRELDFRAPEDRLAFEDDKQIVRSPEVGEWVDAFFAADRNGDDEGRTTALGRIVDANRADHAAAGVPVYAHSPLPEDFVDALVGPIRGLPVAHRQNVVDSLVAKIDPGSKAVVVRQLGARTSDPSPGRALSYRAADPDSDEARRRAEALDKRDPLAALLHPIAYGGDAAVNDLIGEDGLLGDWGKRRVIPKPGGDVAGAAGEVVRTYLQLGVPLGPARVLGGVAANGARGGVRVAQRWGREALIGGGLSVIAELVVNQDTSWWDVGLSFLSGATSGVLEIDRPRDKARLDAALAVGSAVAGNLVKGEEVDKFAALGAGLAAYSISRAGGTKAAQVFGRIGRKAGEKFAKEYANAVLKKGLEQLGLTKKEWDRFWTGFETYWREQWEELIQKGDPNY